MKYFILPSIIFLLLIGFSALFLYQQKINCANSISCINNLSSQVENDAQGVFLGQIVDVPKIDLSLEKSSTTVLGETDQSSAKHIFVDLDKQKLYAFDGDNLILETLVSTGKWGRTPPGEYQIWAKIKSTRMTGGSGNDYYDLPNVPYNMFFYNSQVPKSRGYALHGAYWHNNFGHEMSHGCVNLRPIDAEIIFNWANPVTLKTTTYESQDDPGTQISICNQILLDEGKNPVCLE